MIKFIENEPFSPVQYMYEVEKILFKGKSAYQEIVVFESPDFGRILVLDNIVQLTEKDEFFYHEMLTHVAMHVHPNPKRVVVIGGGDGGTVREVLKHDTVEKVYLAELDKKVIEVAKEYLPFVACAFDDPRLEIHITDGSEFIKEAKDIDIVIVDSTDAIGMARSLYAEEFFRHVKKALKDDGLFATHSESLCFHKDVTIEIQEILKKVFPIVDLYSIPIATYPGNWWSFSIASMKYDPRKPQRPPVKGLRLYDTEVHAWSFLPKSLYERIMNKTLHW